jgi:hypothetical protein
MLMKSLTNVLILRTTALIVNSVTLLYHIRWKSNVKVVTVQEYMKVSPPFKNEQFFLDWDSQLSILRN